MLQKIKTYAIHLGLFLLTLTTTTLAGASWQDASLEGWAYIKQGFWFSGPLLLFLTFHEFGHYFMAKKYKVDVSLPYYIPFFPMLIGTMGAVIRMRSPIASRKQIFDIGIAGPLSGLVIALLLLIYGFSTLPPREHIYSIHPDYKRLDSLGRYENVAMTYEYFRHLDSLNFPARKMADSLFRVNNKDSWWMEYMSQDTLKTFTPQPVYEEMALGNNLLFYLTGKVFADPDRIPPSYEILHNPIILAAFFALFVTALNLIPVGQLDGGHVLYGLFGSARHFTIARVAFMGLLFFGGLGIFRRNIFGINVFQGNLFDIVMFTGGYLYFLAFLLSRAFKTRKDMFLAAAIILSLQFLLELFIPDINGFRGWLLFGFILSRFLGIHHPPALIDEPLDLKRKILGWSCIGIFILCFTPEPIKMIEIVSGK